MRIGEWDFPADLLYDRFHQWVRPEGGEMVLGVTDYASDTAGDILYIELPQPGESFRREEPLGAIEAGKWVGKVYAPFDGVVVAVNEELLRDPRAVNLDPYGNGWLVRLRSTAEPGAMMRGDDYRVWLEGELARQPSAEAAEKNGATSGAGR